MSQLEEVVGGIERHASDPIPRDERSRHVRSLLTLWFSSNMQLTPVVTGAFAVVLGLSFGWAALAAVVGTLLGTVLMAYHSAQGPKLGVPQMIQSRAQFGYLGNTLPLLIVLVIFVGYLALTGVLGAEAFASWSHATVTEGLMLISFVCFVLAVYGYQWIHRYERYVSVLLLAAFVYITVRLLTKYSFSNVVHHGPGGFAAGTFFLAVAAIASYVVTWAPYVSDYSRYLPEDTSTRKTFAYTFIATSISSIWMELIGAFGAAVAIKEFFVDPTGFLGNLGGSGLSGVIFAIVILGVIAANIMNLYSAYMSSSNGLDWILSRENQRKKVVRIPLVAALALIGFGIGVASEGHFYTSLSNFLLLLLYALIPWTAINLVDFYLLRRGQYVVETMYRRNGRYGEVQWRALTVFFIAGLVEVPFMDTTLYEGPIAKALGGADIAWIVGFIVGAVIYFAWERAVRTRGSAAEFVVEPMAAVETVDG